MRLKKIVQLVLEIRHIVRYLPASDMHTLQNGVNGVLGLNPVALQRSLHFHTHDGPRHVKKGLLQKVIIIYFSQTDLFIKPTHIFHHVEALCAETARRISRR